MGAKLRGRGLHIHSWERFDDIITCVKEEHVLREINSIKSDFQFTLELLSPQNYQNLNGKNILLPFLRKIPILIYI